MTHATMSGPPSMGGAPCDHPAHLHPPEVNRAAFPLVRVRTNDGPCRSLVDEWDAMATRPSVLATVNSWRLVPVRFTHLDELLVAAGFGRAVDDSNGDHILWHLAVLARNEPVAARAVLQRLLPALVSVARRRGAIHPGGTAAAIDEVLASAWETLRTYPAERRPVKVAANIVLDSQYRAFVAPVRRRRVTEVAVDHVSALRWEETEDDPAVDLELAGVLEDAESLGVGPDHMALLRRLAAGETTTQIALDSGWSARTIRNRRAAAVDAVRRALAGDAAGDVSA